MGACCGGMKTGQHKSLPENKKTNNIDEKDNLSNGPQAADEHAVPATGAQATVTKQQEQEQSSSPANCEASANHTNEQGGPPSPAAPEEVELKITEPDRNEPEPVPDVCPAADKPAVCPEKPPAPQMPIVEDEKEPKKSGEEQSSSSDVLFVSEEGDIMQVSKKTETQVVQTSSTVVTEQSCTTETTHVTSTTVVNETLGPAETDPVSTDLPQRQEEAQTATIVEEVATTVETEQSQITSSTVVEQAPESENTAVETETTQAEATDNKQGSDNVEVVAEPVTEDSIVASISDDQQAAAPSVSTENEQEMPDKSMVEHDIAASGETAPAPAEQLESAERPDIEPHREEEFSPTQGPVPCEEVDALIASEQNIEVSAEQAERSDEPSEQALEAPSPELTGQEAKPLQPEETSAAPSDDAENPNAAVDRSQDAVSFEARNDDESAAIHSEDMPPPELDEVPSGGVISEPSGEPQQTVELAASQDTETTEIEAVVGEDVPVMDKELPDAVYPAPDDMECKPDNATNDELAEIQPEELPPPPPPELEDVPYDDHQQELPEVDSFVKTTSDIADDVEHLTMNGCIDNVDEHTQESSSELATDQLPEVPVTNEA